LDTSSYFSSFVGRADGRTDERSEINGNVVHENKWMVSLNLKFNFIPPKGMYLVKGCG